MNGEQQLVVAKYSDGSLKGVTRSSIFEVNDEEVGEVDLGGASRLSNNRAISAS